MFSAAVPFCVAATSNIKYPWSSLALFLPLQLSENEARVQQLQEQLAAAQEQVQQLEERGAVLAAERDAAARNLLRAETELNDVGEYSTKLFRQVTRKAELAWSLRHCDPYYCIVGCNSSFKLRS